MNQNATECLPMAIKRLPVNVNKEQYELLTQITGQENLGSLPKSLMIGYSNINAISRKEQNLNDIAVDRRTVRQSRF